jgi:hypothetical protein
MQPEAIVMQSEAIAMQSEKTAMQPKETGPAQAMHAAKYMKKVYAACSTA